MSSPSKDQRPESDLSKPVSTLKKVVFPAPFGPISAVIASRWTSKMVDPDGGQAAEAPGDAVGHDDGVGLGHPDLLGHRLERVDGDPGGPRVRCGRARLQDQLSAVAQEALRPEHQQQDEAQPTSIEAHLAHLDGVHHRLGDDVLGHGLAQRVVGEGHDGPEQHRPHHRSPGAGGAAQDEAHVGVERLGRRVVGRHHRRLLADEVDAGQRPNAPPMTRLCIL